MTYRTIDLDGWPRPPCEIRRSARVRVVRRRPHGGCRSGHSVHRRENPGGLGLFRPWLANEAEMATLIRSCSSTPMLGQNFVWSALGQPGVDRGESVRASRFAVAAT